MIFFGVLLLSVFAAVIAQHFVPPLPGPWFEGARVLLMPVILWYGCLAMPVPGMLALCFFAGFLWDALTLPIMESNVEISLGWSIILYAVLGTIMNGMRPLFRRGRWEIHCILAGVLTSLVVLAEYMMIAVRRIMDTGFFFPHDVWGRVLGSGMCAALMAPIVFFVLNRVGYAVGFDPQPERKGGKQRGR